VTNITFIYETSPNTKPKEKKVGDIAYYVPSVWKSGGTRPPCPPPNCVHDRWSSGMLTIMSICSKHVGCVLCLLNRTDCMC